MCVCVSGAPPRLIYMLIYAYICVYIYTYIILYTCMYMYKWPGAHPGEYMYPWPGFHLHRGLGGRSD